MNRIIAIIFFFGSISLFSQSGITFAEFAKKLNPYYDRALIMDIQKQLPQGTNYKIWGWDVGDYSGDGYNDVAFAAKLASEKNRIVQTYLFVDLDGYLVKVGNFEYPYVDIPLEIGLVIDNNTCMITKKNKQYNWEIQGFSFDNGSLLMHDEFTTRKLGNLTYETYVNYLDLKSNVKLLNTRLGEETFFREYLTIPSYPRGKTIYKGYKDEVETHFIDFVPEGAYYWEGKNDASIKIKSAYDEEYIYMTTEVNDESIVISNCDTCISDYIEVWFDVTPPLSDNHRFYNIKNNQVNFKTQSDSGLFCFSFYPGDYKKKPAHVNINTNQSLTEFQREASSKIRIVSNLTDNGYILKFKIPFLLLGIEALPIRNNKNFELGCTVIAVDYDNEFRPEEYSKIATSNFEAHDPSTYGSLLLIPQNKWYGKSSNIFRADIINNLLEYGF